MSFITIKNLSIGYNTTPIRENINFNIEKGDYLCIFGENGSGKTTLLKTLLGIKNPIKGDIIFGDNLNRNEIGYLPQFDEIQKDFPASVWEVVLSGCQSKLGFSPFYSKENKKTAEKNMEKMGIKNLKRCCFSELSGGQRQRALFARALCAAENVLFLDEPVTGLDQGACRDMYEMISMLNKECLTIVSISHDIKNSIKYCSKVLYLGKKSLFLSKDDYVDLVYKSKTLKDGGVRK